MLKIPVIQLLLSLPITHIILKSFVIACILYLAKTYLGYMKNGQILLLLIFFILTISYFGIIPILFLAFVFFASYLIGKLFCIHSGIIAFLFGFFLILEIYILSGLLLNIQTSSNIILMIALCVFGYTMMKKKSLVIEMCKGLIEYIKDINILDLWIIISCFTISSFPQVHWDSVYANLYNAKWYVQLNGFPVLEESISSLFPQNAIAYYSFFFAIGSYKSFQIAFLLPLFSFMKLMKSVASNLLLHDVRKYLIYIFLFAPIIWFQSSTGYYDLLITVLVFAAIYILLFRSNENLRTSVLASSLFIGFAAGIRHFPLILGLLPFVIYLSKVSRKKINLTLIVVLLVLIISPLGIWGIRSFKYTGSPVFPFFQKYFPTPEFWTSGPLEQNFMIQTTMTVKQWILGGFFTYPFVSYFYSDLFIEGTRGYPTVVFLVMLGAQVFLLGRILFLLFRRNKLDTFEITFLYLFLSYFIVGLVTRYYRYLFPFQFLLAATSFAMLVRYFQNKTILYKNYVVTLGIAIVLLINLFDIFESFRFYPIHPKNLFRPDIHMSSVPDSVDLINQMSSKSEKILDASQYPLPRLYLNARVYQCNWYWIAGDKLMGSTLNDGKQLEFLQKFSYVLTSNPEYNGNYCYNVLMKNSQIIKISENSLNRFYKVE